MVVRLSASGPASSSSSFCRCVPLWVAQYLERDFLLNETGSRGGREGGRKGKSWAAIVGEEGSLSWGERRTDGRTGSTGIDIELHAVRPPLRPRENYSGACNFRRHNVCRLGCKPIVTDGKRREEEGGGNASKMDAAA